MGLFDQKDTIGEGNLKMDQIREAYSEFCGRFVDKDEVDRIFEKCNVQVMKKGMIKFSEFVYVKSKKAID